MQRGNNRMAIFLRTEDYARFYRKLERACRRHDCVVHAYVFMTNHVHLLMTPATATGISRVMQSVGTSYAAYFNASNQRTGGIWEGRYRAILIDSEAYLLTCYRYIERNPVRAGVAGTVAQHKWSSYGANALGLRDPLVTPHERYLSLGLDAASRQAAYRGLHGTDLAPATVDQLREAIATGAALGSDGFQRRIAEIARRPASPSRRAPRLKTRK